MDAQAGQVKAYRTQIYLKKYFLGPSIIVEVNISGILVVMLNGLPRI
jgi:hypothetical protein